MAWLYFLVFFPVLACAFFWAILAGIKIFASDDPSPEVRQAYARRVRHRSHGRPIKVGARDIQEDNGLAADRNIVIYNLDHRVSTGPPIEWVDDLWARRN